MKLHKPTAKMLVTWAVSFICVLTVIFGTTVTVLACIPKKYGIEINIDNVSMIEYMNQTHKKQLFSKDDARHAEPMREIVKLFNKTGKSNKLMDIFRGNPDDIVADYNNVTGIDYNVNFTSVYAKSGLAIWFNTPQYNVYQSPDNFKYTINRGATGITQRDIHGIFIPLDRNQNFIQDQRMFLVTTNLATATSSYIPLTVKATYLGNYYKLWEYVNALKILL